MTESITVLIRSADTLVAVVIDDLHANLAGFSQAAATELGMIVPTRTTRPHKAGHYFNFKRKNLIAIHRLKWHYSNCRIYAYVGTPSM